MIGTKIGNYEVVEQIGEGGMGVVYAAKHSLLDKLVAVKVLLPKYSDNEEVVKRFFNEAKATTLVKHPGIVELYDFGHLEDGSAYIVMEYLQGESLEERIQRQGSMPHDDAAKLIARIANIMTAAHAHGIVHRDLKPENIFLVPDPSVEEREIPKVLDFGIAKLNDEGAFGEKSKVKTRTGSIIGSPLYMSPEQCRGAGTIDHHSDIYSLGCILYELLTAEPPFNEEGIGEIIGAHLHVAPTDPSEIVPDLPDAMSRVVLKALAKKPGDRHSTMEAFARALRKTVGVTTEDFIDSFESTGKPGELEPSAAVGKSAGTGSSRGRSKSNDINPFAHTRTPVPTTLGLSIGESGSLPAIVERRSGALIGILLVTAVAAGGFAYWKTTSEVEPSPSRAASAADQASAAGDPLPSTPVVEPALVPAVEPALEPNPDAGPELTVRDDKKKKTRADAKAKAKVDARAKAATKANAEVKANAEAKARAKAKAESKARAKAKADAKAKAKADAKAKAKANPLTQPKANTKRAGDGALDPFNQ